VADYDFSYGFRPGRSPHQALETFWKEATGLGVSWVLEVDIRKYFDSVNRSKLLAMVSARMGDGVVLRVLSKWLHAGVMEEGQLHYEEAGTPQGGVVSPILSNIYLHEVFDQWFAEVVQERMRGHYWGWSWKGFWVIKRKTAAKRLRRTLKAIGNWRRIHRHRGMHDQFKALVRKLDGHYAYYGITGNARCLAQVRTETQKLWYKWLRRRSRNPGRRTWEWMNRILKEIFVFPYARVVHSIYHAKP